MKDSLLLVGTGALATLFAVKLAAAGIDVSMLGTWKIGLEALRKEGARLNDAAGLPVRATSNPLDCQGTKYAIVLVKSWQTERAGHQLSECLTEDGLVISLQNGLGNDEILAGILGEKRVGRGITTLGATLLGPGHVHLGGEGQVILEKCSQINSLEEKLRVSNFDVDIVNDIQPQVWGKLVMNAAINPLTALLRVKNAGLLENRYVCTLMREIAEEAALVAGVIGISLPFTDPATAVEEVARRSAENLSSMLQDILRGGQTEIDAINGKIVQLGEKHNVPVPVNRTIWLLVNSLSERGNI